MWTSYGIVPVEYDDNNNSQGYDIAHQQEDFHTRQKSEITNKVSGADWPLDLFHGRLTWQTVIKM